MTAFFLPWRLRSENACVEGVSAQVVSRRSWLRAGIASASAWVVHDLPVAQALEIDPSKAEQTIQAKYGAQGTQALRGWLQMLQAQAGKPVMQQLTAVNDFWNRAVMGSEDKLIWGEEDYWATPLESLGKRSGDCEDFVIGKYFSLIHLGVPPDQLRLIYVRARIGGAGSTQSIAHMVLGFYENPTAIPLVLDNITGTILPAHQRSDLTPVFSFNANGIYVDGAKPAPVDRISRWRGLLTRMQQEGFRP